MELAGLEAIGSQDGKITPLGRQMAALPLEPRQAKTLLSSFKHACPSEIVDLLALLSHADTLLSVPYSARDAATEARSKFLHRSGDHLMLLNILKSFEEISVSLPDKKDQRNWCKDNYLTYKSLTQVFETRKQLRERLDRMDLDWRKSVEKEDDGDDRILLCLLEGHFANTAMRMPDGSYRRTTGTMRIKIHPSSNLQGKRVDAILFSELVYTSNSYARIVSSIPLIWLRSKVPAFFAHATPKSLPATNSQHAANGDVAGSSAPTSKADGVVDF